jgi:transcriptional regulator with XRE-family HTH domain
MEEKNLTAFGEKLRQLRKKAGLYQDELAEQLGLIHERSQSKADLRVDGNRISKWERAYMDKRGREWKPRREHIFYLIEYFADLLTLDEALEWAAWAGYQLHPEDIQRFFSNEAPSPLSGGHPPARNFRNNLNRLRLFPEGSLFGAEEAQQRLLTVLQQRTAPWLVTIDGIGGIGKTTLAKQVVVEVMKTDRFHDLAWVSAKQEEFQPGFGLQPVQKAALTLDRLVDELLKQLKEEPHPVSPEEKQIVLADLLAQQPYLVVIDNLETMVDYEILLPLLRQWLNPTKFLLASRRSLRDHPDVFCLTLNQLSQADTLALLRYEAEMRGISALAKASTAQLETIYQVVGGNPLALKLVVGQINVLPLPNVLENLRLAHGKTVDELYTYIYWQAWQALNEPSRATLLVMPLTQGGSLDQLRTVSELEPELLDQALAHLTALSLVEVSGNLEERRYYIHRLTETFLLNEVVKWQQSL